MSNKLALNKIKIKLLGTQDKLQEDLKFKQDLWQKIKLHKKMLTLSVTVFIVVIILLFILEQTGITTRLFLNYQAIDSSYQLVKAEKSLVSLTFVPTPPIPRDQENPINGVLMTKSEYQELLKRHPIAIVVENHTDARPQHGLSQADTVLEVLAEGGITRYVAVYYGNYDVAKIGPVRSLRYYMIEFASGYGDAVILHHGWAGYDGAPWETYRERADARGAVFKLGIKSLQTAASTYRDPARRNKYVHSLYTDFERINSELSRLASRWQLGGEVVDPLKFKYDEPNESRGDFGSVTSRFIGLGGSAYTTKFTYDQQSNTYKRFLAGKPDIDELTGEQIAPKNVIIEWHNYADAQDGHSRLIIDIIGEDKVTILRDGKVIEGKWKKDCRTCRTKYFTNDGQEIELVRGQIWIVNAIKVGERLVSSVAYD